MNCDTIIRSLKNYLESRKVNVREIIQTSRETSKFKSFKVTVDRCNYQQMFSINMWSKGVNVDVNLLQETWQLKNQLNIFENYFPEYNNFNVSSIDPTVLSSGRPYGGLTVLYKLTNRTFYT